MATRSQSIRSLRNLRRLYVITRHAVAIGATVTSGVPVMVAEEVAKLLPRPARKVRAAFAALGVQVAA